MRPVPLSLALCACAAVLTASHAGAAPASDAEPALATVAPSADPVEPVADHAALIAAAERRGRELHEHDQAAWHATDAAKKQLRRCDASCAAGSPCRAKASSGHSFASAPSWSPASSPAGSTFAWA